MLRFVEVVSKALEYDSEVESCRSLVFLRELYINPDYIISMNENVSLKRKSAEKPLVEGMDKNLSFTELTICTTVPSATRTVDVVGAPEEIIEKYYRR